MSMLYVSDKNCETILNIASNNFLHPCIRQVIRNYCSSII